MRTSTLRLTFASLALLPLLAAAQQASDAPPRLERLDENQEPAITIRKDDGQRAKVTEKKEGGHVTEVKVQAGKSTYYLKPNLEQPGNAQPGDAQSSGNRPPQWKVLEFDLGTVKEAPESQSAPAEPPPKK